MISYSRGTVKENYAEVVELCGTWWKDSLFFKLYGIEYLPSEALFIAAESMGLMCIILGREETGKIISCYIGVKSPYPFNPSIMTAIEFVWCIHKDYRTFKNVLELLHEVEKVMAEENIHLYTLATSEEDKYEGLGKLLLREGFNKMETGYSKYFRRPQ